MAGSSRPVAGKKYTYEEFLTWPEIEGERWEWIDGVAYNLWASAMPSPTHSEIITNLVWGFRDFFQGGPCKVHAGQLEVRLDKTPLGSSRSYEVVVPDLVVICDAKKVDRRRCEGAPDLIVEVLSPSSLSHDQVRKLNLYEQCGVPEYWIVEPQGVVMVLTLGRSKRYGRPQTYDRTGKVTSARFPGLVVDLAKVFPEAPSDETPAPEPEPAGPAASTREPARPYGAKKRSAGKKAPRKK